MKPESKAMAATDYHKWKGLLMIVSKMKWPLTISVASASTEMYNEAAYTEDLVDLWTDSRAWTIAMMKEWIKFQSQQMWINEMYVPANTVYINGGIVDREIRKLQKRKKSCFSVWPEILLAWDCKGPEQWLSYRNGKRQLLITERKRPVNKILSLEGGQLTVYLGLLVKVMDAEPDGGQLG